MIEKSLSLSKLTQKQREVLALVADNRTSKEIAALLSISESAVNQRIEMVRTRLGGLPRGELARLYRKELNFKSLEEEAKLLTCEKLQVPESQQFGQGAGAGSVFGTTAGGSLPLAEDGDGSQLAAPLFDRDTAGLWRINSATAFGRFAFIAAIVVSAVIIAVDLPEVVAPLGF